MHSYRCLMQEWLCEEGTVMNDYLQKKAMEEMMLPVNTKMEPVAVEVVAIGSLNACLTEPREVFKHAVLNNAAGIVCFHNHPSGKAEPSRNDGLMTQRLVKAGGILGIPVVDHIIVAGEEYYSFKQDGKLAAA